MKLILQQKQSLNLVMTTELRQAIELLQYSTHDLLDFLKEQELENPLIELVEKERLDNYSSSGSKKIRSSDDYIDPLDFVANAEKNISDHLLEQVKWQDYSPEMKKKIDYLILNLDENGYLTIENKTIAKQLSIREEEIDLLLEELQKFEPVGVGARDLTDCLLIQLKHYYPNELVIQKVVEKHLTRLANKQWKEIAKEEGFSLEEINHAFEIIRTLDPKPAAIMSTNQTEYITPDIIVEINDETGDFEVSLNDYYVPDVTFNRAYSDNAPSDKQMSDYIQNQYKNYQWIRNSIEQRRNTIIKIMEVLIQRQADFFKGGLKALNPLTLKEVAETIDMHESTVSRATSNKILQTPQGSFELRLLFSTKLTTSNGEDTSQTKVKSLLENMIEKEDKYKPLSDQKLSDKFKEEKKIKISRRTIAKYRDELNIPSSSKRKEVKF